MNDIVLSDSLAQPSVCVDAAPEFLVCNAEFFAALSHELRTPLAAIKGFAQTLAVHWDAMPEWKRCQQVEHILRSTLRMERLVQDLSQAARLVNGVSLQLGTVDTTSVITQGLVEAHALHPGRVFSVGGQEQDARLWADRERVLQVLVNLLDNAAKYSPHGAPIIVRWALEAFTVRIEVCDTGLALTPSEQALLFTRFSRLRGTGREYGLATGTGLGLYICKGLVEAMGGCIGIYAAEGIPGNTFWFTVPAAQAD